MKLYPTEKALNAVVSPNKLNLTYPNGTESSIFSLVVATFPEKPTLSGWSDVQDLNVRVSGNVNMTYALSFAGSYGGADSLIRDFEFWNFTYSMPAGSSELPNLILDLKVPSSCRKRA